MCFPGARDDEWLRPRVPLSSAGASPASRRRRRHGGASLSFFSLSSLTKEGRSKLEKDRERRVFLLARFKQPGRFSSAENAAFKSRSASFPRRKSSSWFLFFSLSLEKSGWLRERINEGANGDVPRTGRVVGVRGGRTRGGGWREAPLKSVL